MANATKKTKLNWRPWMILPTFLLLISIWFFLRFFWLAPYSGRLVEAQTNVPVEGAVIIAYWSASYPFVDSHSCLDARETVSDESGEFTIPKSLCGEIFGSPSFYIYKVGYEMFGAFFFDSLKQDAPPHMVQWDGRMPLFQLKTVAKGRLHSAEAWPPSISCGRRDGKALSEYIRVCEEYRLTAK